MIILAVVITYIIFTDKW